MSHSPHPHAHSHAQAAQAFRAFFDELRETYLERETLFTQVELALLCREHVLVVGPPGTAKSAIASAVLGRIVDERTGQPSLFSKQVAESTVQTDLIGPVDFKVLTDTGRTEYITEDGMLGATHAFLDEVFDGRDMLLRSILNVLHERELKHGRRVTAGRTECVIMTSNRYLSEVLARSPEMLLAFADRLSFISFVPKSFARRPSRAAMLNRFAYGTRPEWRSGLSLQQLDVLQSAVERVKVPSQVLEAVEMLADELEKALLAQVAKLPDYVPTKYFSQRSVVKAMWALKGVVVRDLIWRHPQRPLEATVEDLDALRWFFLLGGPPAEEAEALLKVAADPRERAQLEIVRIEQKAFDGALAKVLKELAGGVDREAAALGMAEDVKAVETLGRSFQAAQAATTVQRLRSKLVPGPRHPENREPLLSLARLFVSVVEQRLARGPAEAGASAGLVPMLAVCEDTLELCRAVPDLRARLPSYGASATRFLTQSFELMALNAEGLGFDDSVSMDNVTELAPQLGSQVIRAETLASLLAEEVPAAREALRTAAQEARQRVASALRGRVASLFSSIQARKGGRDGLASDSRRLGQIELALCTLDTSHQGFKRELLSPLGLSYAQDTLASITFDKLEELARAVQAVAESLRQEGLEAEPVLARCSDMLEERLQGHAQALGKRIPALAALPPQAVFSGDAYTYYRGNLGSQVLEGEMASLLALEDQLAEARPQALPTFFSADLHTLLARVEVAGLQTRLRFLRGWLTQLLSSVPAPNVLQNRAQVDQIFDRLVRSRFPLLVLKEGELVRLKGVLGLLCSLPGETGEASQKLEGVRRAIEEEFTRYSQGLLQLRSSL